MTRMGWVFNLDTCDDKRGCQTACKMYFDAPMGVYQTETVTSNDGAFPSPNEYFVPMLCQQCTNPKCVPACEAGALEKRWDGIVVVADPGKCAECDDPACEAACPYGAIHYDAKTKTTWKCDMCNARLKANQAPRCVGGCLTNSRFYGDLDDPESMVSQIIASWDGYVHQLKPETGNEPNVYYLLSKHEWRDMQDIYRPAWREEE